MIRIDEIYNNTFWTWMQENIPSLRIFYCDPPGHTGVENLFNLGGRSGSETSYVFFHDQEPIHLDIHKKLFDEVIDRNHDLYFFQPNKPNIGNIITSEYNSKEVRNLEIMYNWKSYYYFYHGWASLDWYRGYNKSFLLPRARDRNPYATFISPNRIIGGKRDHRILFLYHLFKHQLHLTNHVTCPKICPGEQIDILDISRKFQGVYPDIIDTFTSVELPLLFDHEDTNLMSSCWITNFNESADSAFYVATETIFSGNRQHLTEKTFKPIALEMPFILIATAGSLEYLKMYGFKTFSDIINEDYDNETDDYLRITQVTNLLKDIEDLSLKEKRQIYRHCIPAVEHNYHHFYNGSFEKILWKELTQMLEKIKNDNV